MVKVSTAIHHLEVLNDATEEVDAHGEVNILSEQDWSNIKISSTKKNPHPKIEGVSLNCLLKGIFTLYGIEKCHGLDLPGGVFTWEDILEPTFIALTQIAHVEDVVKRVHVLVIFLHFRSGYNHCPSSVADTASEISSQESASSASGAQPSTQYLASLVYGAFSFLLYWVTCFSAYLTDMDVLCINNGVQRMKGLVVGQPSSSHQPTSSRPSLGGGAEAAASNIENIPSIVRCALLCPASSRGQSSAGGDAALPWIADRKLVGSIWSIQQSFPDVAQHVAPDRWPGS